MTIITEPAAETLPGRTEHETHEYLRDHGHRITAAMAYRYLARCIETDPAYPLPEGSDAVIAAAAASMTELHAARQASAEAYVARQRAALYAGLDEYRAEREAQS